MAPTDLITHIATGFAALFAHDGELFNLGMKGVNEQTITFRLGLYLQQEFPDHQVDCEYNRNLDGPKGCAKTGIAWMKPDVIVHRRQSREANLFCLEAKKAYLWDHDEIGYESIIPKLRALTRTDGDYGYPLGLAWRIVPDADPAAHYALWFRAGEPFYESTLAKFEAGLLSKLNSSK